MGSVSKKKSSITPKGMGEGQMSSEIDYNQPEISPYEKSRMILIIIGNKNYSIPENYVQRYTMWRRKSYITLQNIDLDIGHTILHFLYKGEYETTTNPGIQSAAARLEHEYQRSIQVYYASREYGIYGLETLAQRYILMLSDSLSIFQILRGAKMIFSLLPEGETWFHDYLYSKLSSSFAEDETTFQLDKFYDEIADDHVFSKAVIKMVVRVFNSQLSSLRSSLAATNGAGEVNKGPAEPDSHEFLEQPPEEEPIFNGSPVQEPSVEDTTAVGLLDEPCPEPCPESCPEPCPEPVPAEEYYEEPEAPAEEYCIPELPALDEEPPCGEPPAEPVLVEGEEVTPKVQEVNGYWDYWGSAGSRSKITSLSKKKKKKKRFAQIEAPEEPPEEPPEGAQEGAQEETQV